MSDRRTVMPPRRRLLLAGLGLAAAGAGGWALSQRDRVWNPCLARLPRDLAEHPVVQAAWEGVDPARVWDCHAHIAGTGDSGSGITTSPEMESLLSPIQFAQRLFYLNAGCVHDAPGRIDASYVERMHNLVDGLRPGVKLMLFAFDRCHDEAGRPVPERTAFHVPNAYARDLARRHANYFEWVCSIHPYRPDAVAAIEEASAHGARAVKWLPAAMGMDPASPKCDAFYDALARLNMPLITHAGEEKAVHGAGQHQFGNPLRLRRALDAGVKVIVAHCASLGDDLDDAGKPRASFDLFLQLMAEPRAKGLLHGDISAITQRNRKPALIRTLLERGDLHDRLLHGSDYPLPGIVPLTSTASLARAGLLPKAAVHDLDILRQHNPLLFDFTLKRLLNWQGHSFSPAVFNTRRLFAASHA